MRARRTGRRPGNPDTREAILDAARAAFAERGFDAASIRAIAAAAGVDPALVHHYFGTKEELFRATVAIPLDPAELLPAVLAAGPDQVGERLVRTFLKVWDSPVGAAGLALLRSAVNNEWTARLLREFLVTQVLRRVVEHLDVDPAERALRGGLVASQLAGLIMTRYVIRIEPIASAAPDTLVTAIGPTLQRYLTAPLPPPNPS
ncbi:TetR family transcriptional regulator [Micromonospora sp. NPDC093277]|uniref:TetR/AcrR family transcriptional regulator n=1 Tax=Micromonospora sp. NPDC093277 TaxID=3364291 RepID=UPI003812D385